MARLKRKNVITAVALICAFALLQGLNSAGLLTDYILSIITIGLINSILVVSLNLITGFTGQFSLGHAGFMAIGAYVSAIFTKFIFGISINSPFWLREPAFFISLMIGGLAAGAVAFLVGIPALRLKGDYLAIATLGFNQVVVVVLNNLDFVGGPRGFTGLEKLTTFPWVAILAAASVLVMYNFVHSIFGSQCIAVREDEIAAESLRVDTTKYKTLAFTLSSFFAGLAGALLAHQLQLAHPSQFTFLKSIDILLMLVVGGMGSIPGSIIAAVILTILPEFLRFSQDLRLVIYPVILIVFVLYNPVPRLQRLLQRLRVSENRG